MSQVVVIATGTANTASVLAGLSRAGARPTLSEQVADVSEAPFVVLPGVGAFASAVERIDALDLRVALTERLRAARPTLCVCLGLQLLADASEEGPGARGLGVVPGTVGRFGAGLRAPHMGWNRVSPQGACRYLEPGYAYFANTYRLGAAPAGWGWATSDHGGPFVSALERGGVLACQFHPELSGEWGAALISRWLERSSEAASEESACSASV